MDNTTLIIVVVVVLAILAGAFVFLQQRRSKELRSKFGPEYERAVIETGAKGKAEAELAQRAKRVKKLDIRPLPPGQADTSSARGRPPRRGSWTTRRARSRRLTIFWAS